VEIAARDRWTNVFAEKDIELRFTVTVPAGFKGRAAWSLTSGEGRTLSRPGEAAVAREVKVRLRTPAVREGYILPASLTVLVQADGAKEPAATLVQPLWIFPEDPFHDQKEWLKELKITLFDPSQKTAAVLEKANVPFDLKRDVDALAGLSEGVLIVGEGVSFREERGLAERMSRLAAAGVPVLCLAPAEGSLPLPGADGEGPSPGSLELRRQDVIGRLDKRLDSSAWAPEGKVLASSLHLRAEEGKVVAEVGAAGGWPWLEVEYPQSKSRMIVCGFGLLAAWEVHPTPRFLCARLLHRLAGDEKSSERKTDR
jgi:hypothetical protein